MTTIHFRPVPRIATRPMLSAWPPLRLIALLRTWHRRAQQRHELAELSDERLRDVGLTREMIRREAEKPFWMA